jgi:hypothetical protein
MKHLVFSGLILVSSCDSGGVAEQCIYQDVFGSPVHDLRLFSDPEEDARRFFQTTGKQPIVLSQIGGVWAVEFEGVGNAVNEATGMPMEYDEAFMRRADRLGSPDIRRRIPADLILLVDTNYDVDVNLIGQRAERPSKCYDDPALRSYIGKFNRASVETVLAAVDGT